MAGINLKHICKAYNKNGLAVNDFNLEIEDGEFVVLVGPSGCGKSTILRLVAGLEDATHGEIQIDGKRMNGISPKDRDIAFVFQSYALYPHMNVYKNIAFGLKTRKLPKNEVDLRIKETAQILELENYLDRKPKVLSGGQRQRVALGRAIVRDAKVYLMDEPLSNLDAKLRAQMRTEITKLHQRLQTTFLYVTHDQTEAMSMATRLVVLNNGIIQQVGVPKEVYEKPENVFVGGFLGSPPMNFFTGTLSENKIHIGPVSITIPDKKRVALRERGYINKEIIMGVRPEDIHEASVHTETSTNSILDVNIEATEILGAETIIYSQISDQDFAAKLYGRADVEKGQALKLRIDMHKVHFFDFPTEKRIELEEE